MLVHGLAVVVGLGSLTLYLAAFFFPEVHRRHDFFWSGLGLFYALVLWTCAGQIGGAVLLGQTISIVLLGWLGWQTLALRRLRTPLDLQTPVSAAAWQTFQDEAADLLRDVLAGTPIGRLFPALKPRRTAAETAYGSPIRASSIKDVEYEYLDDLDDASAPVSFRPAATAGAPQAPPSSPSPPSPRPQTPDRPQQRQSPSSLGKAAAAAKTIFDWSREVLASRFKPKPPRPVIDIPPRPPSIPKSAKPPAPQAAPADVKPTPAADPETTASSEDPPVEGAAEEPAIRIIDADASFPAAEADADGAGGNQAEDSGQTAEGEETMLPPTEDDDWDDPEAW